MKATEVKKLVSRWEAKAKLFRNRAEITREGTNRDTLNHQAFILEECAAELELCAEESEHE